MSNPHVLQDIQTEAGAEFMHYGPAPEDGGVQIAQTFGNYQAEYAAIRRFVGIMHLPQRGLLNVTGADRKDYLHRMLTQDINAMAGGSTLRSFQLNSKGRIVADVYVHHGDINTWIEGDAFDLPALQELLEGRLFSEDVVFENWSDTWTTLALHGPAALALLQKVVTDPQAAQRMSSMPGTHHVLTFGDQTATVCRRDECGVLGFYIFVRQVGAEALYRQLLDAAGFDPQGEAEPDAEYAAARRQSLRGRPIGWLALNTARIEAGRPTYHIDFGPDSLPAETLLLDEAVSFTKGCYIGQEIVARMKNLGHPKRLLVGLKIQGQALPIAGAQVYTSEGDQVIGGVTSSTISPVLGSQPIAFAVVKWGQHQPGKMLKVSAEGQQVDAQVQRLKFL